MKVLIVPDKFKGTLSALEAAQAIARGWSLVKPSDELALLPMTDGGDGFGDILGGLFQAERQTVRTVDAVHNAIEAEWWWSEARDVAIVESAKIIGLAMLPAGKFHPFQLDTRGLGQLLRHIASTHPKANLLIGIGGSATNDAGFGLALGLGYRFQDSAGHCLDRWPELDRLLKIDVPADVPRLHVTIASNVQNPLLGPEGASRIYGPQKGLRPEDFPIADRCFERFTEVIKREFARDCAAEPGTGAAGGLGTACAFFSTASSSRASKFSPKRRISVTVFALRTLSSLVKARSIGKLKWAKGLAQLQNSPGAKANVASHSPQWFHPSWNRVTSILRWESFQGWQREMTRYGNPRSGFRDWQPKPPDVTDPPYSGWSRYSFGS